MHKRTRACAISKKTKEIVYERDRKCCIFCGAPGLPEAHYIPRSQGGLGIEQNIVTVCRPCHDLMDNSILRRKMLEVAAEHLKGFYPDWTETDLIYDKWHKDKAHKVSEAEKISKNQHKTTMTSENPQKDKGEAPPEGFYFLEGESDGRGKERTD